MYVGSPSDFSLGCAGLETGLFCYLVKQFCKNRPKPFCNGEAAPVLPCLGIFCREGKGSLKPELLQHLLCLCCVLQRTKSTNLCWRRWAAWRSRTVRRRRSCGATWKGFGWVRRRPGTPPTVSSASRRRSPSSARSCTRRSRRRRALRSGQTNTNMKLSRHVWGLRCMRGGTGAWCPLRFCPGLIVSLVWLILLLYFYSCTILNRLGTSMAAPIAEEYAESIYCM